MMSSMLASRVMPVNPMAAQPMSTPMSNFLKFMAQQGRTGVQQPEIQAARPLPQNVGGPNVGRMLPDPNRVPAPNMGFGGMMANPQGPALPPIEMYQ
jgi:hypothetical protein